MSQPLLIRHNQNHNFNHTRGVPSPLLICVSHNSICEAQTHLCLTDDRQQSYGYPLLLFLETWAVRRMNDVPVTRCRCPDIVMSVKCDNRPRPMIRRTVLQFRVLISVAPRQQHDAQKILSHNASFDYQNLLPQGQRTVIPMLLKKTLAGIRTRKTAHRWRGDRLMFSHAQFYHRANPAAVIERVTFHL